MNYQLNTTKQETGQQKQGSLAAVKKLAPLVKDEIYKMILSGVAVIFSSLISLTAPLLAARVIDRDLPVKNYSGVLGYAGILTVMFIAAAASNYTQTRIMGGVGQRVLFRLRNSLFGKLQELPVAFFNQNKAGDLISRINNDTDNLNQFFSQSLVQFVGNIFMTIGAAIFLLSINIKLGAATLVPAALIWVFTQLISGWVKAKNFVSMQALGNMSAEIQESLENFKVIVAFNRRDYFRDRFSQANEENYKTSVTAGLANNLFNPVYTFASNLGSLIVLVYGIYLISVGQFTIGLLISYIAYVTSFYNPLRQLANLWSNFQQALASWDRVSEILVMQSDLKVIEAGQQEIFNAADLLEFRDVSFAYQGGKEVLHHINFKLQHGKTYALVGPTGGGKSTTASLMARLYDPTHGLILLNDRDIRSYTPEQRTKKIGFILQDPFLFSGTIGDNIRYGNPEYQNINNEQLRAVLEQKGLAALLVRFSQGLETKIAASGAGISLGQKQLAAFMRAVLRDPEILILDEATANIDTVTEQLLEEILDKLPSSTTKVIIAHRLNTIANADEIYFINAGQVTLAGSMQNAVDLLLHGKRQS